MRLSLFFLMLTLLPAAAVAHAYYIATRHAPLLRQEVLQLLEKAGVREPSVEVALLDITIAGEAPSPQAHQAAVDSIRRVVPLRLKVGADKIHVRAEVRASLEGKHLRLAGWLPESKDIQHLKALLASMRPDLLLDASALHHSPEVRWPMNFQPPLNASDSLMMPIIEKLRVPARLEITFEDGLIRLAGMLPAGAVKDEILTTLAGKAGDARIDASALQAGPQIQPATFTTDQSLSTFLASFFAAPPPRRFEIQHQGPARLRGIATRKMEMEWRTQLQPLSGPAGIESQLVLLPSLYHDPDYRARSPVPPAVLADVRGLLRGMTISFDAGEDTPRPVDQARLAALAPSLVAAGPALALIIGGHPDPQGDPGLEMPMAKRRAESVLSFLIEQGVPSTDITAISFEPVPAGSPAAPSGPRIVEILIK